MRPGKKAGSRAGGSQKGWKDQWKGCLMNKMIEHKEVVVISGRHISKLYTQIHSDYRSTGSESKPRVYQREWMTLVSFLNKNKTRRCKTIHLKYPFTILKQERPDFILTDGRGNMKIEIARVTPKNLEAMISICYKHGFEGYESDPRLLDNSIKMSKDELISLAWRPGKELSEDGTYGSYKERMWAELVYEAILTKNQKKYFMDVLLLDDQHIQSSKIQNVLKGLEFLKGTLRDKPLIISNITTIISETQAGIIVLYDKGEWRLEYKQHKDILQGI